MGGVVLILAITVKPIITLLYGEAFLQATTVFYALLPLFRFLNVHIAASGKSKSASLIGFFVYVRFTGTKLWDVVILVKSDWVYRQRFFNIVALKLRHKSDTGQA
jgi:O-antigen/teichoic acid export membrane protein